MSRAFSAPSDNKQSIEQAIVERGEGGTLAGSQEDVNVSFGYSAEDAFDGAETLGVWDHGG